MTIISSAHIYRALPPCEFTMSGYSQHKRDGDYWDSPPFYTGLGGYKMCLNVNANGCGAGLGTHVSVYVCLMRGEHDQLKWPFQGSITVLLVDQLGDLKHSKMTIPYSDAAIESGAAARVTSRERATNGWGFHKFTPHNAVESTTEAIQYLHNDCLKWRVTNIVVRSV